MAEFLCQLGWFCSPPFGEGLEETRYSAADCTLFSRRGRRASSQNTLVPRLQGLGIFCVSSHSSLSIASLGRAPLQLPLGRRERRYIRAPGASSSICWLSYFLSSFLYPWPSVWSPTGFCLAYGGILFSPICILICFLH